jgi:hypothetical protein
MLLFSKRVFLLLCVAALLAGEAVCDGAKAKSKKKSSKKKGGRAAKEEPPAFSREQFEKVIQKGSLKKFSGMLDSIGEGNPVINQQNFGRDGKTLVIHAAEHGATDILKLLLANGGDLHRADSDGWTALMWALRGEHWKATDVLLEHSEATSGGLLKALNARTKNGLSPVLLTVHSVKLAPGAKMFKKLIDLGAVVSVKNDDGEGCFIRVCQAGDTELVKLLIEKGVDVNEKDESDVTGLMYAIVFGHDDLAKFIVAQVAGSFTCKRSSARPASLPRVCPPPAVSLALESLMALHVFESLTVYSLRPPVR